jgi:hypothetical protein
MVIFGVLVNLWWSSILWQDYRYAPLRDTVNTQSQRLDKKDDEIKFLQRQLDTTEKDLNRYKNMALLMPEKNTFYTQMTNEELRIRALNIVRQMREEVKALRQKEHEAFLKYVQDLNYGQGLGKADTGEKITEALRKHFDISKKLHSDFVTEFNKKHVSEVVLIYKEMKSRLPEGFQFKITGELDSWTPSVDLPMTSLLFDTVANELERFALSLPH